MQLCLAGSTRSLISRTTVILLTPRWLAASCKISSPRSARSPSRYTAIVWSLRKTQTRCCVHVWLFAVRVPSRLIMDAMLPSGSRRARSRMRCSVVSLVFQRCCPARFFTTSSIVWSPPFQCNLRRSRPGSTVTTISSSTDRKIRFRVAADAAGWLDRRGNSAPRPKSSTRSASVSAGGRFSRAT